MSAFNPIGQKPWSAAEHRRQHERHLKEKPMNHAHFSVVDNAKDAVTLEDLGPWDERPTITNDAEWVVAQLAPTLAGRRLFYLDSDGNKDELLVKDGKFDGFKAGPRGGE